MSPIINRQRITTMALGCVLMFYLAACGTTPPANQLTLNGSWIEGNAKSTFCGNVFYSTIKLELKESNDQISGTVNLAQGSDINHKGTFSAIHANGTITGQIRFDDSLGKSITWKTNLKVNASSLEGTLTDQEQQPCPTEGSDYFTTEVTFLRQLTEPVAVDNKEPNNSATQATLIKLEERFDLSLSPNDIDWFKFSLTRSAEVEFDVTLLTAMGFRAVILDEDQSPQQNQSLRQASDSLASQANSWQVKTSLAPGDYFLVITGFDDETLAGKHQDNGRYTLSFVSSKPLPDDSSEPNNNPTQATPITLDFSKEHFLTVNDQDWFSFTLSKNQLVQFSLQAGPSFLGTLYNKDLQEILAMPAFSVQPASITLDPGKYFFKLTRSLSTAGYYTLSIKALSVPDLASEPNNTLETATAISLDYKGRSYLYANDEDWYTFNLSEARLVTFDFGNDYVPGLQLLDINQVDMGLHIYYGSMTKYLSAGRYYLRLWNGYEQSIPLDISSVAIPDKANEPNNTMSTATPITLDYSGPSYLYVGDEDWYTFSLNQNRLVTFDFGSHLSIDIRLLDAQGNSLWLDPYGSSNVRSLGPGSYYVQLSNLYSQDLPIIPMTLSTAVPPDDDLEPNNSLNSASAITLPFSHEVYTSIGDEDWYSFSLSSDLLVTYQLSSNSDIGSVTIWVFDSLGRQLTYLFALPGTDRRPLATYLKSGKYYLKVVSDLGGSYTLDINKEILPDEAFEPNNSIEQAYAINVGFEQGNLVVYDLLNTSASDRDYFKFSLVTTTQLDIRLKTETRNSDVGGNLIDSNGNYIYSLHTGNLSDVILPAGTYVLQISPSYRETSKYHLSVKKK